MPDDNKFDVESALDEVTQKTEQQVEEETAYKWASRAIACYLLYRRTAKVDWLLQGDSYRHEAIEHAALVKDEGQVLRIVMQKMEQYRS